METDDAVPSGAETPRTVSVHDFLEWTAEGMTLHPLIPEFQREGITRHEGRILLRTLGPRPSDATVRPPTSKAEVVAAACQVSVAQLGSVAFLLPITSAAGDFFDLSERTQEVVLFHASIFMGRGLEPSTFRLAPELTGTLGRITLEVFMQRVASGATDETRILVDWMSHVRPQWREICTRACLSQVITSHGLIRKKSSGILVNNPPPPPRFNKASVPGAIFVPLCSC